MKLILSRKGFDAASGGCASPIFEDGTFLSLPIPELPIPENSTLRFSGIGTDGRIGAIVEDLTRRLKNPVKAGADVHLDPDLRKNSLPRKPGWRPLFGQAGSPQGHLHKHEVGRGDIFLFFGWFRRVEQVDGRFRFKPGAPDLHMLYGWLEVGEMWRVKEKTPIPVWAAQHPHVTAKNYNANNMIYVAAGTGSTYNAGTFRSFGNDLVLTEPNQSRRSHWRLPKWFHPADKRSKLSCQDKLIRWHFDESYAYVRTVRGIQEFVLDTKDYPEAVAWVKALIEQQGASRALEI